MRFLSSKTQLNKKYVILNAALDTTKTYDRYIKWLYQTAAQIGCCKFSQTPVVDVVDKKKYEQLTLAEVEAIRQADKILIAGHCYEDDVLLDRNKQCSTDASYFAELLGTIFNGFEIKKRKISIVACESLTFGRALIEACSQYPFLVRVSITARKYELFVNPLTGVKYNLFQKGNQCRLFHHSEMPYDVYKSRFSIDLETDTIRCDEVRGNSLQSVFSLSRYWYQQG